MKIYIICDRDGKPIIKKKYEIPLTDKGNGKDKFSYDISVFEDREEAEKYIRCGLSKDGSNIGEEIIIESRTH